MKDEYDFTDAKRGRAAKEIKVSKTIRFDPEVLGWLEEQGEKEGMGYQTYLNWFLRKNMRAEASLLERVERLEDAVFD